MQKDVIYIDVEDDITAIIGKVKASDNKIVALVPPKRTGAIQSAVNLKLVLRAAESAGKRLVLITNNAALMALAGSANIPVAKNLQSRPEVAEIPALAVDDEDDIIDGANIKDGTRSSNEADDAVEDIEAAEVDDKQAVAPKRSRKALGKAAVAKSKIKIPDFDKFRKRLFLIIAGVILLAGFLVWALIFAPSAKVIITARTTDSELNSKVVLGDKLTTSLQDGTLKTTTKTSKQAVSVAFTATGTKNAGDKATATIEISRQSESTLSVPAGTKLTAVNTGISFTTDEAVVVPASTQGGSCFPTACPGTVSVGITAVYAGTDSNGATGSLSGAPGGASATFTTTSSGGTDKEVTVVQQSDIDDVSDGISTTTEADAAKQALITAFGSDYVVLPDSFKQDTSGVKPSPAVGDEASDGKGTLTGDIVYSLMAVSKSELTIFLDAYFAQQIDGMTNQKVYSNGVDSVAFTDFTRGTKQTTANIAATGKYGPEISTSDIKATAKGKRFGEIQSALQEIPGVDSVDVKFSPFWVMTAPSDEAKIQVEFKVNGS